MGAGGLRPARRCNVPVGEIDPLVGRGEGAGGFMSIAPRCGGGATIAVVIDGGEAGCLPLPVARARDDGDGDRDLDRES